MAYEFAAALSLARRVAHDVMAVPMLYSDDVVTTPTELRIRWSRKPVINGDLAFAGWSQQLEGLDSVIFDIEELNLKGITLQRGGTLTGDFDSPFFGAIIVLDSQFPDMGSIKRIWRAVLK